MQCVTITPDAGSCSSIQREVAFSNLCHSSLCLLIFSFVLTFAITLITFHNRDQFWGNLIWVIARVRREWVWIEGREGPSCWTRECATRLQEVHNIHAHIWGGAHAQRGTTYIAHMKQAIPQHEIQAIPHNEHNIHAHKWEAPHSVWHTTTAWSIQSTTQHITCERPTQRNCIYETGNSRRQSTTHTTAAQHKCTWDTSKHARQRWEKPNTAVYVKKSKCTPFPHFASFTTQQALRDPHTNKMSQMICQANFWVCFLATLVALHFAPVSESVSKWVGGQSFGLA